MAVLDNRKRTAREPYRVSGDEPPCTRAHPPSPEVMQSQSRVPLTASILVAIVDRRGAEHRSRRIQDRRLAVG